MHISQLPCRRIGLGAVPRKTVSGFFSVSTSTPLFQHLSIVFLAMLCFSAQAEDFISFPADMPASYRSECGSCHVAFPPGLLSSSWGFLSNNGWRRIMDELATHFGENAALEEPVRKEIEDFLVRNAGAERRFRARTDPPRLSSTIWFRRTHGEVRAAFRDPRIGSSANCAACHPLAESGRYIQLTPLARQLAGKK